MKPLTIHISTAHSRHSKAWVVEQTTWDELAKRCSSPIRTSETAAQYAHMDNTRRSDIKDVGGFVGGIVEGGRRTRGSVQQRTLITLDVDDATPTTWEGFQLICPHAALVYSTHTHTAAHPRLRLVMPLSRPVSPDEYEAIARRIAADVDIEQFDDSTYQAERLMYWPSASKDAPFYFRQQDGTPLDADAYLRRYGDDWRDVALWPISSRVPALQKRSSKLLGDPRSKRGVVGLFCQAYTVPEAIETFLSDIYTPAGKDRYTYTRGTAAAGLVIYDNGLYAYANNATDPCTGHNNNAFDLVRIHLFAADEDTTLHVQQRPSYHRMVGLAYADERVKKIRQEQQCEQARKNFADLGRTDVATEEREDNAEEVIANLQVNDKGTPLASIFNYEYILTHDNKYRDRLWLDDFSNRFCAERLPWRDSKWRGAYWTDLDASQLFARISLDYNINKKDAFLDALNNVCSSHRRNLVEEYLDTLEWDGTPRLDTLFIDYLGAADEPIIRAMTRKQLTAAVKRIYEPGCKHDYCIVLVGEQGIGKSKILQRLGGDYFCDSIRRMDEKDTLDLLQQAWIVELPELAAMQRSEVEAVKAFITTASDTFRPAYGRNKITSLRHCIFFGTTNSSEFLRDATGNRRFWVIPTDEKRRTHTPDDITHDIRAQIWAEAKQCYLDEEQTYLTREQEQQADSIRKGYTDVLNDGRLGILEDYLDTILPADWTSRSKEQRRAFFVNDQPITREGKDTRDFVSIVEILYECFGQLPGAKQGSTRAAIAAQMRELPNWTDTANQVQRCGPYGLQRVYTRTTPLIIPEKKSEPI